MAIELIKVVLIATTGLVLSLPLVAAATVGR
jgi:hypothetical protein